MLKLYAKKVNTNYDRICVVKKHLHESYHREKKYSVLTCSALYQLIFQTFDHTSLSGDIRVRIPQELNIVAFWPWNLNVVAF